MDAPSTQSASARRGSWYTLDKLPPVDEPAMVIGVARAERGVSRGVSSDFYVGEGGKYMVNPGFYVIRTDPSLAAMEHAVATVWLKQKRLVPSALYPHVSGVLLLCNEASKDKSRFESIAGTRVLLAPNVGASELADCKGLPVRAVCIGHGEHAADLSHVANTSQILGLKMTIHSYNSVNAAIKDLSPMFAAKSYSTNARSLVQKPLWVAIRERSVDIDLSHSTLFVGKGNVAHARKFDRQDLASPLSLNLPQGVFRMFFPFPEKQSTILAFMQVIDGRMAAFDAFGTLYRFEQGNGLPPDLTETKQFVGRSYKLTNQQEAWYNYPAAAEGKKPLWSQGSDILKFEEDGKLVLSDQALPVLTLDNSAQQSICYAADEQLNFAVFIVPWNDLSNLVVQDSNGWTYHFQSND